MIDQVATAGATAMVASAVDAYIQQGGGLTLQLGISLPLLCMSLDDLLHLLKEFLISL